MDPRKTLKHLYGPPAKEVVEVWVPEMRFLAADGEGGPDSGEYAEAVEALYALSYTLKFAVKKGRGVDYRVMPLEGLWWTDEPEEFTLESRGAWKWTAMIMQPEWVTDELVGEAREEAERKKGLPALSRLRFRSFGEGRAAQVMHLGPYAEEGPTIERVHRFVEERGGTPAGKHHEIYLSDPNRTPPEKLKTVVRQPFA